MLDLTKILGTVAFAAVVLVCGAAPLLMGGCEKKPDPPAMQIDPQELP